MYILLQRYSIS